MAESDLADCSYDRRYRAMVLLATFASLRWGEITALRRCDLDLDLASGVVHVRLAYSDRREPGSKITLGPLKSRAGRRTVGIPAAIGPQLAEHLAVFVAPGPEALIFAGATGSPHRRSNFNKMSGWKLAAAAIAAPDLHFHDLRYTGNHSFLDWSGMTSRPSWTL